MTTLAIIIVGIIGAGIGYHLASRGARSGGSGSVSEREKRKGKVLAILRQAQDNKITNNDVEEILGVSDATAERYLNELEKEGKLVQHGSTGKSVFYTLK